MNLLHLRIGIFPRKSQRSVRESRLRRYAGTCCLALGALAPLRAQEPAAPHDASPRTALVANLGATFEMPAADPLPNAPGFAATHEPGASESSSSADRSDDAGDQQAQPGPVRTAPHEIATIHTKIIQPDMVAPKLSPGDKVLLGLANATSSRALSSWVAASVYEQAFNRAPNYGQTAKGFAQRFGASVARDSSETIFSDSVLAPILREDPRYYRLGPGHSFLSRVSYAATRVVMTRGDSGAATVNFSLLGGNLAGAALTQAYYPARNTGLGPTMKTYGASLGGSAVGFVFDEFLRDALALVHHDHAE